MNPFFSVIIPTYNRANSLNYSLSSLVKQTFKDFEVIVCDDGSSDNTLQVVEGYKNKLNIKYFFNSNFGGPAYPRNIGLKNSKGVWICFLDSDYFYFPERLENLYSLNLENYDFIYHKLDIKSGDKKVGKIKPRKLNAKNPFLDLLINSNTIPTSSTCIRKEILLNEFFSEDRLLIGIEDYDLWLRLSRKKIRFYYFSKTLGIYNLGDNITIDVQKDFSRILQLYKKHKIFLKKGTMHLYNVSLNYHKALCYYSTNEIIKANKVVINSILKGNLRLCLKFIKLYMIKNLFK